MPITVTNHQLFQDTPQGQKTAFKPKDLIRGSKISDSLAYNLVMQRAFPAPGNFTEAKENSSLFRRVEDEHAKLNKESCFAGTNEYTTGLPNKDNNHAQLHHNPFFGNRFAFGSKTQIASTIDFGDLVFNFETQELCNQLVTQLRTLPHPKKSLSKEVTTSFQQITFNNSFFVVVPFSSMPALLGAVGYKVGMGQIDRTLRDQAAVQKLRAHGYTDDQIMKEHGTKQKKGIKLDKIGANNIYSAPKLQSLIFSDEEILDVLRQTLKDNVGRVILEQREIRAGEQQLKFKNADFRKKPEFYTEQQLIAFLGGESIQMNAQTIEMLLTTLKINMLKNIEKELTNASSLEQTNIFINRLQSAAASVLLQHSSEGQRFESFHQLATHITKIADKASVSLKAQGYTLPAHANNWQVGIAPNDGELSRVRGGSIDFIYSRTRIKLTKEQSDDLRSSLPCLLGSLCPVPQADDATEFLVSESAKGILASVYAWTQDETRDERQFWTSTLHEHITAIKDARTELAQILQTLRAEQRTAEALVTVLKVNPALQAHEERLEAAYKTYEKFCKPNRWKTCNEALDQRKQQGQVLAGNLNHAPAPNPSPSPYTNFSGATGQQPPQQFYTQLSRIPKKAPSKGTFFEPLKEEGEWTEKLKKSSSSEHSGGMQIGGSSSSSRRTPPSRSSSPLNSSQEDY